MPRVHRDATCARCMERMPVNMLAAHLATCGASAAGAPLAQVARLEAAAAGAYEAATEGMMEVDGSPLTPHHIDAVMPSPTTMGTAGTATQAAKPAQLERVLPLTSDQPAFVLQISDISNKFGTENKLSRATSRALWQYTHAVANRCHVSFYIYIFLSSFLVF